MKKFLTLIFILIICIIPITGCNQSKEYSAEINPDDIALLTIFSFDGKSESKWGLMNLGHAFLMIENVSDNSLDIVDTTLDSNKAMCIGTWSIREHFGVWYNVESNYYNHYNKYDGRVSVTIGLSEQELDTLCEFIVGNDRWNPLNNCSKFALNAWNSVATEQERLIKPLIYTPGNIVNQLKQFENFEINRPMNTDNNFGYFDNSQYVSFEFEGGGYESV